MKTKSVIGATVLAFALVAAAGLLSSCSSTPADPAAKASDEISDTRKNLERTKVLLTRSFTALSDLTDRPASDMRSQYKKYLSSVKELESTAGKVGAQADAMMQKGDAYFADWDLQVAAINDQEMRTVSGERKQKLQMNYEQIKARMLRTRDAFRPLLSDLKDIGSYLGNNLTTEGVAAIKPRLQKTKTEAVAVRDAATAVIQQLDELSSALSAK